MVDSLPAREVDSVGADLEIVDLVAQDVLIEHEDIRARAAGEAIRAALAEKHVVSGAAVDGIVAVISEDQIVSLRALVKARVDGYHYQAEVPLHAEQK